MFAAVKMLAAMPAADSCRSRPRFDLDLVITIPPIGKLIIQFLSRIRGPESGRFLRNQLALKVKIGPEAIVGCCQTGHKSSIFFATDELYRCLGVAFTQQAFLHVSALKH